jgi:hypothetical protein
MVGRHLYGHFEDASPGTPATLTVSISLSPQNVHCGAASFLNVGTNTSFSNLSISEQCASSPPPVTSYTLNTQVGASFTDIQNLAVYGQAGNFSFGGKVNSGTYKTVYHLVANTPGVSYITASGKSYP